MTLWISGGTVPAVRFPQGSAPPVSSQMFLKLAEAPVDTAFGGNRFSRRLCAAGRKGLAAASLSTRGSRAALLSPELGVCKARRWELGFSESLSHGARKEGARSGAGVAVCTNPAALDGRK